MNYKFTVVHADEKQTWNQFVFKSKFYDIYHTQFYHSLENSSPSIMFVAEKDDVFIAFPFKLKKIEENNLFDLISVYGYCGPISNNDFKDLSEDLIHFFHLEFNSFCNSHSIVSVFSRLHPANDYGNFFKNFGIVADLNKTVFIDTSKSEDDQVSAYRKSTKYEVKSLEKKGYNIYEAKNLEDTDDFIEQYYKTMKKVRAIERYYFDSDYFHGFLKNEDYDVKLLIVKKEKEFAAGAIFTISNNIMQYHLATSNEKYLKDAPMKFLIDQARKIATKQNLKFLHLGGGFAGSDTDNLFLFKSGFSHTYFQFKVWKHITNEIQYEKLVLYKNLRGSLSGFFPLYRH